MTLLLTSADIAQDLALAFYITEQGIDLHLQYQNCSIETREIEGVYCGINAFGENLWERFSPRDAEYAARETQALWLAILSSLPCRIVNPPALDTLAGTLLSSPAILYLAHQIGFKIPMAINLESGKVAAELLATNIPAYCADLGEMWINESVFRKEELNLLSQNEDHFRVVEETAGRAVYVTLVGDEFFACVTDANGSITPIAAKEIPTAIGTRLHALQKQLNLVVEEYGFRVLADSTWVFCGYKRPPSAAVVAYGDALFEQIADYTSGIMD